MNFKCDNYTKNIITNGLITAVFFSSFIYLEHYGYSSKIIDTIAITLAYILLVTIDKRAMFVAGFFIGIFWFWWISISFIYYDLKYLIPLIILVIAMSYGFLFYLTAYFSNIFIRVILLITLNFLHPFGFNWLKLDLPLINTYYNTYESDIKEPNIKIKMPQYNINQEDKWKNKNIEKLVDDNFNNIIDALQDRYDLIILPETIFPLDINRYSIVKETLEDLSQQISIVTGGLSQKENKSYNSTYIFTKTKTTIANKVVLVPFGEAIPAPKIIRKYINKIFFNGASDYEVAKKPTTFEVNGIKFRNAICYEATSDEIYKNLDTRYIIAISNNAWFTPSIEPTLQKLLLKYYAKKYKVLIYHSVNGSKNMIIK